VNSCPPVRVSPEGEPYGTLTAPASILLTMSPNWGAGRQVSEAVVVEVAGRQHIPERVAGLHGAADLGEQLAAGAGDAGGRAVQHAHHAGILEGADARVSQWVGMRVGESGR
jgi:hypothetical protein